MPLDMLATWALVGLIAGCLARFVLKVGGYGLIADLLLGLAGSIVGGSIFHAFVLVPDGGGAALLSIAFAGAASMIVAQRLWCRGA
jgi:uncharacterized membrane protein YeaQ/YmgE (transglycosylase-associated protein family)